MMGTKQIASLLIVVLAIVGGIVYVDNGKVKPTVSNAPVQEIILSVTENIKPEEIPMKKEAMIEVSVKNEGVIEKTIKKEPVLPVQDRVAAKVSKYDRAKEIVSPSGYINTQGKPIKIADYVGKKVILLDIITYTCSNCIATMPYVNDWYTKYEDKGLIVIGIHTPEFEFEKVQANVEAAMKKYNIKFPIVLDNDYGTWNAYGNRYWPRKYLIDIDGFIRYDHIGEGAYAETEEMIKVLLEERAEVLGM